MKKHFFLVFTALLFISYSCKTDTPKKEVSETKEIRQWQPEDTRSMTGLSAKRGLISKTDGVTPGYVLFNVIFTGVETYLINMDGDVVHSWESDLSPGSSYLQENGHLIQLERDEDFPTFAAGGQAGRIREYDWDGNLLWDFKYANEKELIHHDIEVLPNGNILAIAFEVKSPEEALEAGRDPHIIPKAGLWPDKIIEIKPTKPSGGEIVWEWHMWDHLIQDKDASKKNFGVLSDNPRKININIHEEGGPPMSAAQIEQMKQGQLMTSNATVDNQGSDMSHVNAIGYNAELDQIVFSVPHFHEIFIIDHSTTSEEAKGSTGGRWGHGGDLLYRWGNPANYDRGSMADQDLFGQHDVKWIPKGYPGEGHIMVFNNDIRNPNNKLPSIWAGLATVTSPDALLSIGDLGNHSAVFEFIPPTDDKGGYIIPENASIGPDGPIWMYTSPDKYSFYSAFISGAQRLKNGNTMVTSGAKGRFIEVTPANEIVWEYWNPYKNDYALPDGSPPQPVGPFIYGQYRSTHFMTDFSAFKGKDLKPIRPQPEPFIFKMPPPSPQEGTP